MMTRHWALAALLNSVVLCANAPSASAQTRPAPELGVRATYSHLRSDGDSDSRLTFPGEAYLFPGSLYATLFVGRQDAVEPHFGIIWTGGDWVATLGGQLTHFFRDGDQSAPLAFVHVNTITGGGGGNTTMIGGGVGHRWIVRKGLGVRLEGRYRRWTDGDVNEFSLVLGMGARLLD